VSMLRGVADYHRRCLCRSERESEEHREHGWSVRGDRVLGDTIGELGESERSVQARKGKDLWLPAALMSLHAEALGPPPDETACIARQLLSLTNRLTPSPDAGVARPVGRAEHATPFYETRRMTAWLRRKRF
jgi:hypothetical protein